MANESSNNISIVINVDKDKFTEIAKEGLAAFDEQELHKILTDALVKYLDNSDIIRDMFIEKHINGYSSYGSTTYQPTNLLKKMIQNIDISKDCEPVINAIKDYITSDPSSIVKEILIKSFSEFLGNKLVSSNIFTSTLEQTLMHSEMNIMSQINKG